MRQKYVITRDGPQSSLTIREYAVTESKVKKAAAPMLEESKFSFLCEETYEEETIMDSVAKGINAMVGTLRTHNIYPIEPHAAKIAESVITLYNTSEDDSVELFFDDVDLVAG